jgi:hypothetical protein
MVGFLHNSRVLGFSGFTESMMNNLSLQDFIQFSLGI